MQDWGWPMSSPSAEQSPDTAESPLITNTLNDDPGDQSLIGLMRIFDLVTSVVLNFSLYKRHSESTDSRRRPLSRPWDSDVSNLVRPVYIYFLTSTPRYSDAGSIEILHCKYPCKPYQIHFGMSWSAGKSLIKVFKISFPH